MIERLKNCPNCAGILDEVGRCSYCGSKVYDFLTIDFDRYRRGEISSKAYIRVRTCGVIKLIPILYVGDAELKIEPQYNTYRDWNGTMRMAEVGSPLVEMNINFQCGGDIITYEEEGDEK